MDVTFPRTDVKVHSRRLLTLPLAPAVCVGLRRNTASATYLIVKIVMRRLEVVRDVPRVAVAALMDAGLRRRRLERVA